MSGSRTKKLLEFHSKLSRMQSPQRPDINRNEVKNLYQKHKKTEKQIQKVLDAISAHYLECEQIILTASRQSIANIKKKQSQLLKQLDKYKEKQLDAIKDDIQKFLKMTKKLKKLVTSNSEHRIDSSMIHDETLSIVIHKLNKLDTYSNQINKEMQNYQKYLKQFNERLFNMEAVSSEDQSYEDYMRQQKSRKTNKLIKYYEDENQKQQERQSKNSREQSVLLLSQNSKSYHKLNFGPTHPKRINYEIASNDIPTIIAHHNKIEKITNHIKNNYSGNLDKQQQKPNNSYNRDDCPKNQADDKQIRNNTSQQFHNFLKLHQLNYEKAQNQQSHDHHRVSENPEKQLTVDNTTNKNCSIENRLEQEQKIIQESYDKQCHYPPLKSKNYKYPQEFSRQQQQTIKQIVKNNDRAKFSKTQGFKINKRTSIEDEEYISQYNKCQPTQQIKQTVESNQQIGNKERLNVKQLFKQKMKIELEQAQVGSMKTKKDNSVNRQQPEDIDNVSVYQSKYISRIKSQQQLYNGNNTSLFSHQYPQQPTSTKLQKQPQNIDNNTLFSCKSLQRLKNTVSPRQSSRTSTKRGNWMNALKQQQLRYNEAKQKLKN